MENIEPGSARGSKRTAPMGIRSGTLSPQVYLLRRSSIESKTIHPDTLLDDLQEKMTVFPYYIAWRYELSPTLGYNYDEFRALTGFRSPREICRLRGVPFLTEYFVRKRWIHPVVESFRIQTVKDLGLNEWDVPPIR